MCRECKVAGCARPYTRNQCKCECHEGGGAMKWVMLVAAVMLTGCAESLPFRQSVANSMMIMAQPSQPREQKLVGYTIKDQYGYKTGSVQAEYR